MRTLKQVPDFFSFLLGRFASLLLLFLLSKSAHVTTCLNLLLTEFSISEGPAQTVMTLAVFLYCSSSKPVAVEHNRSCFGFDLIRCSAAALQRSILKGLFNIVLRHAAPERATACFVNIAESRCVKTFVFAFSLSPAFVRNPFLVGKCSFNLSLKCISIY